MKILQVLEDSKILLKGVTKTIKNETKEQRGRFLSMLLGTVGASLLGNLLLEKGIVRTGSENKKGKGTVRAGYGKEWDFQCRLILQQTLKYKLILRMNQDLMELIFNEDNMPKK